jgi:hypothetical protein
MLRKQIMPAHRSANSVSMKPCFAKSSGTSVVLATAPESLVGHHVIAQIVDQFDAQLEEAFGAAVSFRFGNEIVAGVSSELFQDCLIFGQTLEPSLNELTINIQGPASVGGVSNAQQRFQIAVLAEGAGEVVPVGETGAV